MDSQMNKQPCRRNVTPTEEQKKMVIELYQQGHSMQKCAKIAGFATHHPVWQALIKAGIPRRSKFEVHRKYHVNHSFYDDITTEAQAYWLGFTYTDGCILENDYTISFCLSRTDQSHLEKLKIDAGIGNPIHLGKYRRDGKEYQTCTLAYHSKPVWTALQKLGMTFRKSHTVIPPVLPEHLERHFWRGAMDGDGTICHGHSTDYWTIRYVGSFAMVNGLIRYIEKHIPGVQDKSPKKSPGCYFVAYNGLSLPQDVARLLYADSVTHLDRKKRLADQLMVEVVKRRNLSHNNYRWVTQQHLDEMRQRLPSWAAVGRELGIPTKSGIFQLRDRIAGKRRIRTPYVRSTLRDRVAAGL